jgi:hypothetical protein
LEHRFFCGTLNKADLKITPSGGKQYGVGLDVVGVDVVGVDVVELSVTGLAVGVDVVGVDVVRLELGLVRSSTISLCNVE